jgi:hypothetical protein
MAAINFPATAIFSARTSRLRKLLCFDPFLQFLVLVICNETTMLGAVTRAIEYLSLKIRSG